MYKQDLTLYNLQKFIYHETHQPREIMTKATIKHAKSWR